jgi:hypothetical protein
MLTVSDKKKIFWRLLRIAFCNQNVMINLDEILSENFRYSERLYCSLFQPMLILLFHRDEKNKSRLNLVL